MHLIRINTYKPTRLYFRIMKPIKTWIVVADGTQMRVFFNDGPGHGMSELADKARSTEIRPSRDIDADRPGRTHDSAGQGRHAMEPSSDSSRHAKRLFSTEIADEIKKAYYDKAFDRLVLVAAPSMLGDLRAALAKEVQDVIYHELAKDLTHLDERDLADHLRDILAL